MLYFGKNLWPKVQGLLKNIKELLQIYVLLYFTFCCKGKKSFCLNFDQLQYYGIAIFTGRGRVSVMIVIDAWCFHTTLEKTNKPCQITATMKNIIIVHYMQYLKDILHFHIWSSTKLQELLPDGQFLTV